MDLKIKDEKSNPEDKQSVAGKSEGSEGACECMRIEGHLEAVKWQLYKRDYKASPGFLALGDWIYEPHLWLHYVESCDGHLTDDDVLRSIHSRYWSIHDPTRYFQMDFHCDDRLFSLQYPSLRLPTRHGTYLWRFNTSTKLPDQTYHKMFVNSLEVTLKITEHRNKQMDRLIISDHLINVNRMDKFKRQTFFRLLNDIISAQNRLQLVSFENMAAKRLEGLRLVQQLAAFSASTLKYLFLWRFVLPNENPILINYSYITGSGQYIPRPDTRWCFLRSLGSLTNLRVLALEYSHIADTTGAALLSLLPILKRPHFRLQLICREDHIPGYTNAELGAGGHDIPDIAWHRVHVACPDLYVLMAFFRIRDYDNVRRFLTPSIPLRETHWDYGIDLKMKQRQDSDVSCFIRHIAFRYASTLVTLSIHQWSFAKFPLRRVLELMPFLTRFFYVGRVEDEVDLERMMWIISCGVCHKLKHLRIQIQDEGEKREYWRGVVAAINKEYRHIIRLYDITFCIEIYKS